jgi:hypothetical protein
MNVNSEERSQTPRGRFVRIRKVAGRLAKFGTVTGSEKGNNPKAIAKSLRPTALVRFAVVGAATFILRITEDEITRITEDGTPRCIE